MCLQITSSGCILADSLSWRALGWYSSAVFFLPVCLTSFPKLTLHMVSYISMLSNSPEDVMWWQRLLLIMSCWQTICNLVDFLVRWHATECILPVIDWFPPQASITLKVINGIYCGVKTVELDNLAAETAATMTTKHPDYAVLAARIAISNLHKETKKTFSGGCFYYIWYLDYTLRSPQNFL